MKETSGTYAVMRAYFRPDAGFGDSSTTHAYRRLHRRIEPASEVSDTISISRRHSLSEIKL